MIANPYGKYVEALDVLACLEDTPARIESLVRGWPRANDEHSHAPGKWTARQVLTHLAHIEMVFANRLRFALAQDNYLAGVAIGLWRTDAPLVTRLLLAVLWPIGPLAFVMVVAILVAAAPIGLIGLKPR